MSYPLTDNRFSFGDNWKTFLDKLDEDRIEKAENELRSRFEVENFDGKTFLDAGCGSGLFSLAAARLGADRIVSFDFDPASVECCKRLSERTDLNDWTIERGDLLDEEYMGSLGKFDFVYCWGVAHHTGDMWSAIGNVLDTVATHGVCCLGVYNYSDEGVQTTERWKKIKRLYVPSPKIVQDLLVYGYGISLLTYRFLIYGENPIARVRDHDEMRGMEYWVGARDWIGGYPYEAATPEEVEKFVVEHTVDFDLLNEEISSRRSPSAVNTYVFERV